MPKQRKYTSKRIQINGKYYTEITNTQTGKVIKREEWTPNPFENSNQKNRVQNKAKEQYWAKRRQQQTQEETAYEQLRNIQHKISQYPNITELTKEIKKEGVIKFKTNIRTDGKIDNNKLIKQYHKILKDKIQDPQKREEIIKQRYKTLKNRLAVKIEVITTNGGLATIDIGNVPLETEIHAHEFWNGRYIDSNTIQQHTNEFIQLLGNPQIHKLHTTGIIAGTVRTVNITWTFA